MGDSVGINWGHAMNRLITTIVVAGLSVMISGCGNAKSSGAKSSGTGSSPRTPVTPVVLGTPSAKPFPPEYRVLAENLALEMRASRSDFQDNRELAQIISEGHACVLALRGVRSVDSDILYIAEHGQAAVVEALARLERVNALPRPPDAGTLIISSLIGGFYTLYTGDPSGLAMSFGAGLDANQKQNAIVPEIQAFMAALDKVDAVQMLLPTVATKYAATPSTGTMRFVVDIDESWGGFGPHDWFCINNSGPGLEDCTIQVQLTGSTGQVRKNIHFVRHWPANTWMYARYEPGQEILGRQAGRMTVTEIQKADVTVWSPQFTTSLTYTYHGTAKDKDIAERCSKMSFTGRYQPFQKGILWNTQRGCYFTLDGFPYTPKCRADVTFKNGTQSKGWYWEFDYWKAGDEKYFGTNEGQLTFDPEAIDLTLSFPGSSYQHKVTLNINE
jgi:hypothetical protein